MSERGAAGQPSPRAWMRVDTPEAGYADRVVGELARVAATPSGRVLLEQIRASGGSVLIEKPARTDPPNASVGVRPPAADAVGSSGSDCIIGYDPKDWPSPVDPASPSPDVVLFTLLRAALSRLGGGADPAVDPGGGAAETADIERFRRERSHG